MNQDIHIGKIVGIDDMAKCEKEIWLGDTAITVNDNDVKSIE